MCYSTTLMVVWCCQTRRRGSPLWMGSQFTTSLESLPSASIVWWKKLAVLKWTQMHLLTKSVSLDVVLPQVMSDWCIVKYMLFHHSPLLSLMSAVWFSYLKQFLLWMDSFFGVFRDWICLENCKSDAWINCCSFWIGYNWIGCKCFWDTVVDIYELWICHDCLICNVYFFLRQISHLEEFFVDLLPQLCHPLCFCSKLRFLAFPGASVSWLIRVNLCFVGCGRLQGSRCISHHWSWHYTWKIGTGYVPSYSYFWHDKLLLG